MNDRNNIFKISTLILSIILILIIGYVGVDKFKEREERKVNEVFQKGYSQGVTDVVVMLYQNTENCQIVPITVLNQSKNLADVNCIQKAIDQIASKNS